MSFDITYKAETINGNTDIRVAKAYTKAEAEQLCEAIEKLGWKIIDVNRGAEEYGL